MNAVGFFTVFSMYLALVWVLLYRARPVKRDPNQRAGRGPQ